MIELNIRDQNGSIQAKALKLGLSPGDVSREAYICSLPRVSVPLCSCPRQPTVITWAGVQISLPWKDSLRKWNARIKKDCLSASQIKLD